MYRIGTLARRFALSRSTLLYYDRIGLLSPSGRSDAGYRLYSAADGERLGQICAYRQAGMGIEDIGRILAAAEDDIGSLLRRRLLEIGEEIRGLQVQQRVVAGMLKACSGGGGPVTVDKKAWVEMLSAAGMDEAAMERWHAEFERRAPQAHHDFLLSLGIPESEAQRIRDWSRGVPIPGSGV